MHLYFKQLCGVIILCPSSGHYRGMFGSPLDSIVPHSFVVANNHSASDTRSPVA